MPGGADRGQVLQECVSNATFQSDKSSAGQSEDAAWYKLQRDRCTSHMPVFAISPPVTIEDLDQDTS